MFIEKFISPKVRKVMLWIIASWFIVGSIVLVGIPAWKADRMFTELSYGARVDSIKFVSGHRGHPYVLMNNEWRLLTIEEMKVVPILQIGDSLAKTSESTTLHVYRKKGATYELLESLD
jgi:hypothetical protein